MHSWATRSNEGAQLHRSATLARQQAERNQLLCSQDYTSDYFRILQITHKYDYSDSKDHSTFSKWITRMSYLLESTVAYIFSYTYTRAHTYAVVCCQLSGRHPIGSRDGQRLPLSIIPWALEAAVHHVTLVNHADKPPFVHDEDAVQRELREVEVHEAHGRQRLHCERGDLEAKSCPYFVRH